MIGKYHYISLKSTNFFSRKHVMSNRIQQVWTTFDPLYLWKTRSSHRRCFVKKAVLKNFAIFAGKHLCWSLFLKRDSRQVFSCEYCEILKNTYFEKHLRTAASGKPHLNTLVSWVFINNKNPITGERDFDKQKQPPGKCSIKKSCS